jgi:hypothetical protein
VSVGLELRLKISDIRRGQRPSRSSRDTEDRAQVVHVRLALLAQPRLEVNVRHAPDLGTRRAASHLRRMNPAPAWPPIGARLLGWTELLITDSEDESGAYATRATV